VFCLESAGPGWGTGARFDEGVEMRAGGRVIFIGVTMETENVKCGKQGWKALPAANLAVPP